MGNNVGKQAANGRKLYLVMDGRPFTLAFSRECKLDDITEILTSVAGVCRWTNLIMKRQDGSIVVIEPNMPLNTSKTPYTICVNPARDQKYGEEEVLKNVLIRITDTVISKITAAQLKKEFEEALKMIEGRMAAQSVKLMELQQLHQEISEIREQLRQDKITWRAIQDNMNKPKSNIRVARPVASYPRYNLNPETLQFLKKPTFNIWHWEPNEMVRLLEHMFHDLDLVSEFKMNINVLRRFLMCIQANYRNNPFHNFRHCFCVTQMLYALIYLCNLRELLSSFDVLILVTACVCHDLDHPGYNNTYQINAETGLSILYNDISPLENHHASTAFDILSQPEYNIFGNLPPEMFKKIRQEVIMVILATDMARHSEIVENFRSKLGTFDFKNVENLNSLKMILVKCCDISNEVRPVEVADPWVDCLLEEYFMQSDREKAEGLPVAPFMDRDKVTKPTAQIGFIKFVLIPLFELLSKLFPQIDRVMVTPLRRALDHYEKKRIEEEELRKGIKERHSSDETEGHRSRSLNSSRNAEPTARDFLPGARPNAPDLNEEPQTVNNKEYRVHEQGQNNMATEKQDVEIREK